MKKAILFFVIAIILGAPLAASAASCCYSPSTYVGGGAYGVSTGFPEHCSLKKATGCESGTEEMDCTANSTCKDILPLCCVFKYASGTKNFCYENASQRYDCSLSQPNGTTFTSVVSFCADVPDCAAAAANTLAPEPPATAPAKTPDDTPINPKLSINIPTLNLSDLVASRAEDGTITVPYLAVYLSAWYRFGVALAAILAVIMIMIGGFRWLSAAGSVPQIGEAKKMILNAVIGLILAFGSYVALQIINPELVNLRPIILGSVSTSTLNFPTADIGSETGNFTCISESSLVTITNTPNVAAEASDNRLASSAKGALGAAAQTATKTADPGNPEKNVTSGGNFSGLKVFSAVRTQAYQQDLFKQAVAKYGSEAEARKHVGSGQTCDSPHLSGQAADVHLMLGGRELTSADMSPERIDTLENIMNAAGWVRYCPEWWHFEYNLPMGAKRARPCDRPYGTGNSAFK